MGFILYDEKIQEILNQAIIEGVTERGESSVQSKAAKRVVACCLCEPGFRKGRTQDPEDDGPR